MEFSFIVPHITERLKSHHNLYSSQCKAEYWEENLYWALKNAGVESDWKPDFNHKCGVDQTLSNGIRISNKGGIVEKDYVKISGSRLTKHKTIEDKLNFLSEKKEDYIFSLAIDKEEWDKNIKRYYFIVIDTDKLDYHNQNWFETFGTRKQTLGKLTGWKCLSEGFSATITKGTSDQLWTDIKLDICEEIHQINIK